MKMEYKRGSMLHQVLIHLILIALVFALFFFVTAGRADGNEAKQQVVEKQVALLIDSASAGMSFTIYKQNMNGVISDMKVEDGKVFAYVDGSGYSNGYEFFTKYDVSLEKKEDRYIISVE